MNRFKFLTGVLAAIGMVACGGTEIVGSRYVKSQAASTSAETTIAVTAADSADLAGTKLVIPSGALKNNQTITLEIGMSPIIAQPAGPVASWGPDGLKFTKPVKMTLPFSLPTGKSNSDISIFVRETDGKTFSVKNSDLTFNGDHTVSFVVSGFTSFQPTAQPPVQCMADRDCAAGQVCTASPAKPPVWKSAA